MNFSQLKLPAARRSSGQDDKIATGPRKLLDTANSASAAARNAWLGFLFIMAYLAVTLAGVSHKDLVLNTATKLPFVNVEIPLIGFFSFAPIVLLLAHFGLLVQHQMLYDKLVSLRETLPEAYDPEKSDLRDEIHSYFFSQSVVGKPASFIMATAYRFMTVTTFILFPFLLLFYFQTQFLPYHAAGTTWLHRIVLLLDVAVLVTVGGFLALVRRKADWSDPLPEVPWFDRFLTRVWDGIAPTLLILHVAWWEVTRGVFWSLPARARRILDQAVERTRWWLRLVFGEFPATASLMSLVVLMAIFVATVPDAWIDRQTAKLGWLGLTRPVPIACVAGQEAARRKYVDEGSTSYARKRSVFAPSALFFERRTMIKIVLREELSGRTIERTPDKSTETSWECWLTTLLAGKRNLDVADIDFVKEKDRHDDEVTHSLRNRDFSYADFSRSDLKQVDFENSTLRNASLVESNLNNVRFRNAKLHGADLVAARLHGADLRGAELHGANLFRAELHGADRRRPVQARTARANQLHGDHGRTGCQPVPGQTARDHGVGRAFARLFELRGDGTGLALTLGGAELHWTVQASRGLK